MKSPLVVAATGPSAVNTSVGMDVNPGTAEPVALRRVPATQMSRVAWRVLLAVGAGYALSAAVVALSAPLAARLLGLARSDGVVLSAMLGFVLYTGVLVWAFAERSLARVTLALGGGAAAAWALLVLFD